MRKIILFVLISIFVSCAAFAADPKVVDSEESKEPLSKLNNALEDTIDALTKPMDKVVSPILQLGRIVVTSTKKEESLGSQSSSVSAIGEKEFNEQRLYEAKNALKDEMGLDVVETGAFTGVTSVFMRGANSNMTMVMIDGIQVYDPTSPNAAYNIAHLTLDNVHQIEIVRGPQSVIYGSDAIGGVINVMTKKALETMFNATFEAGAFSTFRETFQMGDKVHNFHYSIAGSNVKSRGISAAQAKNNNPELDGYERYAISSRVDYDVDYGIIKDLTVGATLRYTHAAFDIDEFGADDPNARSKYDDSIFSLYVDHKPFDFYSYGINVGWVINYRRNVDANEGNAWDFQRQWYKGYLFSVDYRNNIHIMDVDTFTIGIEYTEEMADSYQFAQNAWGTSETDMPKVFAEDASLYLQNRFNFNDRLTATQGMRIDKHSMAKLQVLYKLDGSYLFPTGTKIRGGWATGFKAPTLYQLHALPNFWFMGGEPDLRPETSESYEMGLDQYMMNDRLLISLTYYHMMFHDLIDAIYNPATWMTGRYTNVGKAHSHGIEFGAHFKPLDNLEIRGSYTYDYTKDYSTDTYMLRRPLHKFKINTYWEIVPKWAFDCEILYNGLSLDWGSDKLKSYAVVNCNTTYQLSDNFKVFLKVDNLFDKRYEDARGYGASPAAVYVGTKAQF